MYLESVGLKNLRELYLHREQINCAIASLEEIEHCSAGQEAVGEQTRPLPPGAALRLRRWNSCGHSPR